jgi:hypothetical protein
MATVEYVLELFFFSVGILNFPYPPATLGMGAESCSRPNPRKKPGLVGKQLPYGLMSPWDMINCNVCSLAAVGSNLMLDQLVHHYTLVEAADLDGPISSNQHTRTEGWLSIIEKFADDFEWQAVHDQVRIIRERLAGERGGITHRSLSTELKVLMEMIDDGLKWQLIYRYPNEKKKVLENWKDDWKAALKAFPSADSDIFAGVDLWALGHGTASVFHSMRVLEHGLRALAKDVGKSFDTQNWQNIIDQIESEIRQLGKALPAGSAKNNRLQFLSQAAKEFLYFKDGWRNYVSHNRGAYDEHQARSVMEHVRSFMTTLSKRLSEEPSAEQSS